MASIDLLEGLTEVDPLARFILSKEHFAPNANRVRAAVFMPTPVDRTTSVFAIRGLSEHAVWRIGQDVVATPRGKPLYARADVLVSDVTAVGLGVVLDNTPPRHAKITRWPDEKSAQKLAALELASRASLRVNSSSVT